MGRVRPAQTDGRTVRDESPGPKARAVRPLPFPIDAIHFVGIGGIGMSGLAEILINLGYTVQGSDLSENANVQRLRGLGATIAVGHDAAHLGDARLVVISSAVKPDNPEVAAARARKLPVIRRAEMLAELMRLTWSVAVGGTHGKTTTTSLVAAALDAAEIDPTVINGGIINAYGANARLGGGEWVVAEADESDGSFVKLPATCVVVTNIDPEHLDHYGDFDALRAAFDAFVGNIPFYGFAAICIDHAEAQKLVGRISDRRIVTYGLSPQADLRAVDLTSSAQGVRFAIQVGERARNGPRRIDDLFLPMLGEHNVTNACAAAVVAGELGASDDALRRGFAAFGGVKRRFTRTGTVGGVSVIDDYGHHPVEIAAVLKAARAAAGEGRVAAVVQPHRYSRLSDLFEEFCTCFNDADAVFVADVYAAGETPIPEMDADALVDGLRARGHHDARRLSGAEALAPAVADYARAGDLIVCLGAGSITHWANALPGQLEALGFGGGA